MHACQIMPSSSDTYARAYVRTCSYCARWPQEGHILTRTASDAAAAFLPTAAAAEAGDRLLSTAARTSLKPLHHVILTTTSPILASFSIDNEATTTSNSRTT